MFDRIYVQSHNVFREPLDVGALAEAALFYRNTELFMGRGSVAQLLNAYGADNLVEFVSQGYVTAHYSSTFTAIHTQGSPDFAEHRAVAASVGDGPERDLVEVFRRVTGRSGYGARKASAFLDAVRVASLPDKWEEGMHSSLRDEIFVTEAVKVVARNTFGPGMGGDITVEDLRWSEGAIKLKLGRGWTPLRAEFLRERGEALTPAHLLSAVVGSLTDLQLASGLGADLSTGDVGNELLRLKCAELERATAGRLDGISRFQQLALPARDIRAAVNSGDRDLRDVMALLDKADRFKNWLDDVHPSDDLVKEYLQAVTEKTWADDVPTKVLRLCTTGFVGAMFAGPVGAAVGLGLGAVDEFVVDRMLRGWRPNQFIDGALGPFVGQ